ncbi:protein NRT1/ PTR FAMILY 2.13-like [Gastrolobium bilobum]|uniref:protein NRT1/ PTR FAMILY 2.13-like n=1 Tax=Gastrolobium bilobum TaxID=150636 RepID=UPI002AB18684|nr:protein NRT1/ PTR FAMILY 2.13-like [Gastrolobium bilobum]
MIASFMVYLLKVFNLSQVGAANVISIRYGVSNFIPIIGTSVADAYLGKFKTISMESFGTLVEATRLANVAMMHAVRETNQKATEDALELAEDRDVIDRRLNAFRKHKPPSFVGSYDTIAAARWLRALDKIFRVMQCVDSQKLMFAMNWNSRKSTKEDGLDFINARTIERKPGWKAIPFILANETIERIATFGMTANFMVYLLKVFNLSQIDAANVLSIWYGVSSFIPIIGASLADAYLGKFKTIAVASFGTLVGMVILTLTAWVSQFHPPSCSSRHHVCVSPNTNQLAILILGLSLLGIGTGGIRPCSIPFAIDQFDTTSPDGRKGVSSFLNWYYTTQTLVQLINNTIVVYIQNKNWVIGFGILALLMLCAIITFFAGTRTYFYQPAEGSIFSGIAQVFVAAYKKRHLKNPANEEEVVYYDPPLRDDKAVKIPLSKQLRFLNKAALIQDNEVNAEGLVTNPWSLCSIQQVEEVKCVIKIIPIWASGILCLIPMAQGGIFPVIQVMKMDRHLGPHFEIPAASFSIISLISIGIWLPCYDLFVQRALAKFTKQEEGLTSLQKIVIGNIFSILTMVSGGLAEWRRRSVAISHGALDGVTPMSAMWLAPQFAFLGLCEVFSIVGHIQFYNSESPENMKTLGNSLQPLVGGFASYAGVLVMNIVHKVTRKHGKVDWLNNDINAGRLDYYYFVIAGLGALNLVYLLFCAKRYRYKVIVKAQVMGTP